MKKTNLANFVISRQPCWHNMAEKRKELYQFAEVLIDENDSLL